MLRYLLTGVPLLALGFSVSLAAQAQQQPPLPPTPGAGEDRPGMMPPDGMGPRMGQGQGPSGSLPIGANGIPQDGPRAGLPPMGLPDGHKKLSIPRVRPQYTPGEVMPAVPHSR